MSKLRTAPDFYFTVPLLSMQRSHKCYKVLSGLFFSSEESPLILGEKVLRVHQRALQPKIIGMYYLCP